MQSITAVASELQSAVLFFLMGSMSDYLRAPGAIAWLEYELLLFLLSSEELSVGPTAFCIYCLIASLPSDAVLSHWLHPFYREGESGRRKWTGFHKKAQFFKGFRRSFFLLIHFVFTRSSVSSDTFTYPRVDGLWSVGGTCICAINVNMQ